MGYMLNLFFEMEIHHRHIGEDQSSQFSVKTVSWVSIPTENVQLERAACEGFHPSKAYASLSYQVPIQTYVCFSNVCMRIGIQDTTK